MKAITQIDKDTKQALCLLLAKAYCETDTGSLLDVNISMRLGPLTFDFIIGMDFSISDYIIKQAVFEGENVTRLFKESGMTDFMVASFQFIDQLVKEKGLDTSEKQDFKFNALERFDSQCQVHYLGDHTYRFY